MALTKSQILDEIDNMAIYSRDREIIEKLLEIEPTTFSVIIENVILGNLYWSDFESILTHTNYQNMVTDILEKQHIMRLDIASSKMLSTVDESSRKNPIDYKTTEIGIPENPISANSDENTALEPIRKFYNDERQKLKDELIYELTRITPSDNNLTLLVKIKLYELLNNSDLNKIGIAGVSDELSEEETLTIDDIFYFIDTYTLPISISYQNLTASDYTFMKNTGISEDTMKKIKSLNMILHREMYLSEEVKNENI